MKRIAILHEDLEWAEQAIHQLFSNKGHQTDLLDIRNVQFESLMFYDLVLNRVYASVANRNIGAVKKALEITRLLEQQNIKIINSHQTSLADYSKYHSYLLMKQCNVTTPPTYLLNGEESILDRLGESSFPMVLKRDTGGRGFGIKFLESPIEAKETIASLYKNEMQYVLQEFIPPDRAHDARIAIFDGEYVYSFGRTLLTTEELGIEWLASVNKGSKIIPYAPTKEEIIIAIKATEAIGAMFNEVDLCITKNGPVIIENNPTPNYIPGDELLVERLVNNLEKKFL